MAAISKSQATIEFSMDGTIQTANENFLTTMGYSLDEVKGRHHGMFVEESFRHSAEYKEFWAKLNRASTKLPNTKELAEEESSMDPSFLQSNPRPQWQAVQGS